MQSILEKPLQQKQQSKKPYVAPKLEYLGEWEAEFKLPFVPENIDVAIKDSQNSNNHHA